MASAVLVFLLAEPESKLMYIGLFGYYPIIKALVEKLRRPIIEWIIKLSCFISSVSLIYYVIAGIFGISLEDINSYGKYGIGILLILGIIVFILYDIAISRMAMMYIRVLQGRVRKILK